MYGVMHGSPSLFLFFDQCNVKNIIINLKLGFVRGRVFCTTILGDEK
jgi:hypothetical protein